MQRLRPGILALVLLLALTACGSDEGDDDAEPAGEATTPPPVATEPPTEPAPTPTPTPEATGPERYEVQQGDTLWGIAERFGVSVDAIVEANGIDDPSRIFPGDELVIPPGD